MTALCVSSLHRHEAHVQVLCTTWVGFLGGPLLGQFADRYGLLALSELGTACCAVGVLLLWVPMLSAQVTRWPQSHKECVITQSATRAAPSEARG